MLISPNLFHKRWTSFLREKNSARFLIRLMPSYIHENFRFMCSWILLVQIVFCAWLGKESLVVKQSNNLLHYFALNVLSLAQLWLAATVTEKQVILRS